MAITAASQIGGAGRVSPTIWQATATAGTGNDTAWGAFRGDFWMVVNGTNTTDLYFCANPSTSGATWTKLN